MTTSEDERRRYDADLAWSTALDAALVSVGRALGVPSVPYEAQCQVAGAVAAALAAIAPDGDRLDWERVGSIAREVQDQVRTSALAPAG